MTKESGADDDVFSSWDYKLSPRDQALFLIRDHDIEAQLLAIRGVLQQNRQDEATVTEAIKALDHQIRTYDGGDERYQMHMEDHWADTMHGTVFQDAAHSMSAVGMLAPFVESLFVAFFTALRAERAAEGQGDPRAKAMQDQYWNAQLVFRQGEMKPDLVAGIAQLSTSIGLQSFLPEGYEKTFAALFGYRNNMFHNGFEWPMEARLKFGKRIATDKWPEAWFSKSTSGDEPWIFYMSDVFIEHCLTTIDQVIAGVGKYLAQAKVE